LAQPFLVKNNTYICNSFWQKVTHFLSYKNI
jgi:hypothetical protein